ncbi:MAG TPA: hypothetical protein VHB93_00520, partial [Candidatus Paceibacterota bacterium]|nr:hypothetical protein [Candidatus Paceibacterota bacterium]
MPMNIIPVGVAVALAVVVALAFLFFGPSIFATLNPVTATGPAADVGAIATSTLPASGSDGSSSASVVTTS